MMYIIIIGVIIIILYNVKNINISTINKREKNTIYECGYHEIEEPREKFYMKFYILAIIFLIFDLETILLYPISYNVDMLN